jgi:hypothetical protein
MLFLAAKLGLFEKYGILMFGFGQLIYYGMCLAVTFYLSNYKIMLMRKLDDKDSYLDPKTKKILK